jgi:hypothetical protein
MASIDLWWLPLGAGGWFVRLNGRVYEALHALVERRRPLDLYHWGRDELGTGEMWNSNSVVSWLLTRAGLPADELHPPPGGRAPGWHAGLVAARRQAPGLLSAGAAPGRWWRGRRP